MVTGKNPSRRRDAVTNREGVLDAAERVLRRSGTGVALEVIAREAGVGIATLYRNFADRDALYAAVTHRAYELVAQFAAAAQDSAAPPLEALSEFLDQVIKEGDRLVLPMLGGPRPLRGSVDPVGARITASLTVIIARGIDDGSIRADADATDIIVAGAMVAHAQLPEPAWRQLATRHARLLLDGLRAQSNTTALPPTLSRAELDLAITNQHP